MKTERLITFIFLVACILSGTMMFAVFGNSHLPERYGPSVMSWMIGQWLDPGSSSEYAWLILPASFFLVWRRRNEISSASKSPDNRALILILLCLFFYWAGFRTQQPRLGLISMFGLFWSVPLYLWGYGVARLLLFPCAFCFFAIPLGFLSSFTFPLRLISSAAAAALLNGLGISAIREGTKIMSATPGLFALDVADPCSGLQSLTALTAITAIYAYVTQPDTLRKWVLFLSAVPLAMAGNIIRIVSIAIIASILGQDLAMKASHYLSGFIVFATAVILMMTLGALLDKARVFDRK